MSTDIERKSLCHFRSTCSKIWLHSFGATLRDIKVFKTIQPNAARLVKVDYTHDRRTRLVRRGGGTYN